MKPQRRHPTHIHTHQVAMCKLPVFSACANKTNLNSKTGLLASGLGQAGAFFLPSECLQPFQLQRQRSMKNHTDLSLHSLL